MIIKNLFVLLLVAVILTSGCINQEKPKTTILTGSTKCTKECGVVGNSKICTEGELTYYEAMCWTDRIYTDELETLGVCGKTTWRHTVAGDQDCKDYWDDNSLRCYCKVKDGATTTTYITTTTVSITESYLTAKESYEKIKTRIEEINEDAKLIMVTSHPEFLGYYQGSNPVFTSSMQNIQNVNINLLSSGESNVWFFIFLSNSKYKWFMLKDDNIIDLYESDVPEIPLIHEADMWKFDSDEAMGLIKNKGRSGFFDYYFTITLTFEKENEPIWTVQSAGDNFYDVYYVGASTGRFEKVLT